MNNTLRHEILVRAFAVLFLTLSIGSLASAYSGAKKSGRKSYPDGYFHCETRTNDGREIRFGDYGPTFEIAQQKAIAKCVKAKGYERCYPAALCLPISINTPVQCAVISGRDVFTGYGVNEEKAESAAKRDCSYSKHFETCLAARLDSCRTLQLNLNFDKKG